MANLTTIHDYDLVSALAQILNGNFAALNAELATVSSSGDVTGGASLSNIGRLTKVTAAGAIAESIVVEANGRILIGAADNGTDKLQVNGSILSTTLKGNLDWNYLQNLPATFTPAAHSHIQADVTGLAAALADKASLSGAYANPAWITSLDWAKLVGVPATFAPSAHAHSQAEVANLVTDLASKLITPDTTGAGGLYLKRNAANNGWEFGAGGTGGEGTSLIYSTTAPTGSGNAGDLVFNSAPIAGGHVGWICISGTTWKRFGVIDL